MTVQPGLCRTCSETTLLVFPRGGSFTCFPIFRTVGMGELNMVLNGVEFRTRHNDYRLRKPAQHSKNYDAMENIVYPKVPWAVASKKTVQEQIVEMREWFKGIIRFFVLSESELMLYVPVNSNGHVGTLPPFMGPLLNIRMSRHSKWAS